MRRCSRSISSLANIGLDLIGQATHFLALAGETEGKGRDADALAFHRDVLDFRNCLLVEQPNGDFAQTIARQFLFSNWQELLMQELATASVDAALAAIARQGGEGSRVSRRYANEWVVRLGDGTEESRTRMIAGLDWMWRFVDELFDGEGWLPPRCDRAEWDARIDSCADARQALNCRSRDAPSMGGRDGHHSEHLGHLLTEMQFLQRAYPGATW